MQAKALLLICFQATLLSIVHGFCRDLGDVQFSNSASCIGLGVDKQPLQQGKNCVAVLLVSIPISIMLTANRSMKVFSR